MRIPELSDESRTDIFIRIYGKLLSQFDSMSTEVIFLMMLLQYLSCFIFYFVFIFTSCTPTFLSSASIALTSILVLGSTNNPFSVISL